MCDTVSSALPRAVISRSALAAASAHAVRAGGAVADLRRDAWGHGLLSVAHAVVGAGARAVRVDGPTEAEMLRHEGIEAIVDVDADIDPRLLYGLPGGGGDVPPRAVMRLTGRVLSTKTLRAGEGVSYGYTHRAPADTRVALVTGGYAQGIVRAIGNRAHAEIDGRLRRIVGRVAMDVCVLDLGDPGSDEGAGVDDGAEVTFFGGTGPAASALTEWSAATGLRIGELVSVVGQHAPRAWEA